MTTRFKIVVPSYNSYPWIERTLSSIEAQDFPYFDAVLVDDASTDRQHKQTLATYAERNDWTLVTRTENGGPLAGLIDGVAAHHCTDDDVIVVVDGDDWLANEWVLQKVDAAYSSSDALFTYGQYLNYRAGTIGHCGLPKPKTVRKRRYRKKSWLFSHLRTFKYLLWRQIRDEDLRDSATGDYFRTAGDLATMFPMAEMAGPRFRFIPEVLYIYNDANPISDFRVRLQEQQRVNQIVRKKKPYAVL
jgi:glycosyltransferase involved in cell wall biosynthesis